VPGRLADIVVLAESLLHKGAEPVKYPVAPFVLRHGRGETDEQCGQQQVGNVVGARSPWTVRADLRVSPPEWCRSGA